jgi:hypothetical protein
MGCLKAEGACTVENKTQGVTFDVVSNLNEREAELIRKGGLLPYTRTGGGS